MFQTTTPTSTSTILYYHYCCYHYCYCYFFSFILCSRVLNFSSFLFFLSCFLFIPCFGCINLWALPNQPGLRIPQDLLLAVWSIQNAVLLLRRHHYIFSFLFLKILSLPPPSSASGNPQSIHFIAELLFLFFKFHI